MVTSLIYLLALAQQHPYWVINAKLTMFISTDISLTYLIYEYRLALYFYIAR